MLEPVEDHYRGSVRFFNQILKGLDLLVMDDVNLLVFVVDPSVCDLKELAGYLCGASCCDRLAIRSGEDFRSGEVADGFKLF